MKQAVEIERARSNKLLKAHEVPKKLHNHDLVATFYCRSYLDSIGCAIQRVLRVYCIPRRIVMDKAVRVLTFAVIMLAGFASTAHAVALGGAPAPTPPGTPR